MATRQLKSRRPLRLCPILLLSPGVPGNEALVRTYTRAGKESRRSLRLCPILDTLRAQRERRTDTAFNTVSNSAKNCVLALTMSILLAWEDNSEF